MEEKELSIFDKFKKDMDAASVDALDRVTGKKDTTLEDVQNELKGVKTLFGLMGTGGLTSPGFRPKTQFKLAKGTNKAAVGKAVSPGTSKLSKSLKDLGNSITKEQKEVVNFIKERIPKAISDPKVGMRLLGLGVGGVFLVKDALDAFKDDPETSASDKARTRVIIDEYEDAVGDSGSREEAEAELGDITERRLEDIRSQKKRIERSMGEF